MDFIKLNKTQIKHTHKGLGRNLREDLVSRGGATSFYRTNRQQLIVNRPVSMFQNTHMYAQIDSGNIPSTEGVAEKILRCDTSLCEGYDEPGVSTRKLEEISMDLRRLDQVDYLHRQSEEGTSATNTKRQRFKKKIDHLNNQVPLIKSRMGRFFTKTYQAQSLTRDTRLGQATKELERQQVKLMQLDRQREFFETFSKESELKKKFLTDQLGVNPLDDLAELSMVTLKTQNLQEMRMALRRERLQRRINQAASKIQQWWRCDIKVRQELRAQRRQKWAATVIQRGWKRLLDKRLARKTREARLCVKKTEATRIKKYLKGYLARKRLEVEVGKMRLKNQLEAVQGLLADHEEPEEESLGGQKKGDKRDKKKRNAAGPIWTFNPHAYDPIDLSLQLRQRYFDEYLKKGDLYSHNIQLPVFYLRERGAHSYTSRSRSPYDARSPRTRPSGRLANLSFTP